MRASSVIGPHARETAAHRGTKRGPWTCQPFALAGRVYTGHKQKPCIGNLTMPRPPRRCRPGCSAHVTVRCNNRAFDLQRKEPRLFVLHALARAAEKFGARIYAVAVMSNHVHYLIEPRLPDELPRVMHWLNWYTAMGLNRLLGRRGHFWEARYHASWVSNRDQRHVLNVLRYIHGNPFAAGVSPGFRHEFTNYGSYASGAADGITTWHPQFLRLGRSLEECAVRYRRFCRRYRPADKPDSRSIGWGGRSLLGGLMGEMARKASFGREASHRKATGLFDDLEDRVVGKVSVLRDDAIDHRRPAVWSLGHDGLAARSAGHLGDVVPGKTPRRIRFARGGLWLEDPIRAQYRMFRLVNGTVRGYPPDVPWSQGLHADP
jgi:putative transposase